MTKIDQDTADIIREALQDATDIDGTSPQEFVDALAKYGLAIVPVGTREALERIAAFNDEQGNAHLKARGSYGGFDEPGSVEIARAALRGALAGGKP